MQDLGVFRAYGALLTMAVLPIFAGSYASLRMPKEAKKRLRAHRGEKEPAEDEDDEDDEEIDRLTAADAYMFPVLGSIVLFGLYLAFQYLSKEWINRIVGGYMALMGIGATARMLAKAVELGCSETRWKAFTRWKLSLHKNAKDYGSIKANTIHIVSLVIAIVAAVMQQIRPHWIVSNVLALAFAFNAISLLRLDSFFTGSALLSLLFIYDCWWVFGSKLAFGADVMVSVATNLEAPIKVQFPKDLAAGKGMSLLGLGDIVLPGIFIALALRYDYHRAIKTTPPPKPSSYFPRPYFRSVLTAYVVGLITTVAVMHRYRAAQPALLYLSPACIGSIVLCAIARGELTQLWSFDDSSDDEKSKDKKEDDAQKKGTEGKEEVGPEDVGETAESTSIEVPGQRVLRNRVVK